MPISPWHMPGCMQRPALSWTTAAQPAKLDLLGRSSRACASLLLQLAAAVCVLAQVAPVLPYLGSGRAPGCSQTPLARPRATARCTSATSCWRSATCPRLRYGGLSTGAPPQWHRRPLESGLRSGLLHAVKLVGLSPWPAAMMQRLPGRGYLVNEEVERAVWARAFKAVLPRGARAVECGLLLTEPLLNLPALQESTAQACARLGGLHVGAKQLCKLCTEGLSQMWGRTGDSPRCTHPPACNAGLIVPPFGLDCTRKWAQLVFEDFGFASLLATPAPPLVLAAWAAEAGAGPAAAQRAAAGLVVDAGFSFMHAAPVLGGRVLSAGVRRVNLGGKALTNYLKELVSYRCAPRAYA